jgi:hypothetical protein
MGRPSTSVDVACAACGNSFRAYPYRIARGWGRFCGRPCASRGELSEAGRFWAKVKKSPGCWLWQGALTEKGYGMFHRSATAGAVYAHRYALEEMLGRSLTAGEWTLHHCDVRHCVRNDGDAAHVYAGTARDNTADMLRRNRGRWRKSD